MACKLRCPTCGTMCKEEGDEMKSAPGTYTVELGYKDNWATCSECGETTPVSEWKDE